MSSFSSNSCGSHKLEIFVAAVIAVSELLAVWLSRKDNKEMESELSHYKDEAKYFRTELDRTRKDFLAAEKELHETNLNFQEYVYRYPPAEEEAEE
jgi:5-bromo-4-chloroindolyl phosphate hydrolysis protein